MRRPAIPTAGYTVMSWHCVSVRGANGDATPYCFASASTFVRYAVESAFLDEAESGVSAATAFVKFTRAESSLVTGAPLPRPPPPRPPRPAATAASPQPGGPPRPPRPAARFTPYFAASASTCELQRAESAADGPAGASFARAASNCARARFAAESAGDAPWLAA